MRIIIRSSREVGIKGVRIRMCTIRWSSITLRMIIGLRGMRSMSRLGIRIIRSLRRDSNLNSRGKHHSRDNNHRDKRLKDNHHRDSHRSDSNSKDNSHLRTTDSNEEGTASNRETSKRSTAKIE